MTAWTSPRVSASKRRGENGTPAPVSSRCAYSRCFGVAGSSAPVRSLAARRSPLDADRVAGAGFVSPTTRSVLAPEGIGAAAAGGRVVTCCRACGGRDVITRVACRTLESPLLPPGGSRPGVQPSLVDVIPSVPILASMRAIAPHCWAARPAFGISRSDRVSS